MAQEPHNQKVTDFFAALQVQPIQAEIIFHRRTDNSYKLVVYGLRQKFADLYIALPSGLYPNLSFNVADWEEAEIENLIGQATCQAVITPKAGAVPAANWGGETSFQ